MWVVQARRRGARAACGRPCQRQPHASRWPTTRTPCRSGPASCRRATRTCRHCTPRSISASSWSRDSWNSRLVRQSHIVNAKNGKTKILTRISKVLWWTSSFFLEPLKAHRIHTFIKLKQSNLESWLLTHFTLFWPRYCGYKKIMLILINFNIVQPFTLNYSNYYCI